jgi:peptide/nickel transport system permease protein
MHTHSVLRYIVRRVVNWLLSVLGAFTIAFLFFHIVPGDPIGGMIGMMASQQSAAYTESLGGQTMIDAYKEMFGLDQPLYVQYYLYFKNLLLKGDMGLSLMVFPDHAQVPIFDALPWTIGLLGVSTIIAWLLGVLIGGVLGWLQDSAISRVLAVLSMAFQQIPSYLMALFLLLTLGYGLRLFPTRGAYTPLRTQELTLSFILDVVRHAMLPGLAVVVVSFAGWVISSRSLIISILGEDYLIFAKAKGLTAGRIFSAYALRNALLPQVTGLGMSLGFIVNGAYLVENFYAYPGMGWVFVRAIAGLDYNVIQGIVFISITAVLTANLLIDLVLPLVDPRVQLGGRAGG